MLQSGLAPFPAPRLDHIFGCWRGSSGKLRRIDVILVTPAQLPFALIGWIGALGAAPPLPPALRAAPGADADGGLGWRQGGAG